MVDTWRMKDAELEAISAALTPLERSKHGDRMLSDVNAAIAARARVRAEDAEWEGRDG